MNNRDNFKFNLYFFDWTNPPSEEKEEEEIKAPPLDIIFFLNRLVSLIKCVSVCFCFVLLGNPLF